VVTAISSGSARARIGPAIERLSSGSDDRGSMNTATVAVRPELLDRGGYWEPNVWMRHKP
jgi:hypothetical protein